MVDVRSYSLAPLYPGIHSSRLLSLLFVLGRDHFPAAWSCVFAGGGIKGGQAYGKTNKDGTSVAENPVKVGEMFATIYKALGIDPTTQIRDAIGRPFGIAADGGKPIEGLV